MSGDAATVEEEASPATEATSAEIAAAADFKPTRRVRDPPGGATHRIFGDPVDDDALATAPPKPSVAAQVPAPVQSAAESPDNAAAENDSRPKSRRTTSSVAALWDAPENNEGFKPTRRVREMPGGKDSISGIFEA
ncbi:hypothetical protein BD414DRAFT_476579 [Trametes punicea]|nr:hypothetical protein BD414DRAFT_476579 [Trametes punicea]